MTLSVHALRGCSPTPLAHYLKALAILRLVAEQADPQARGFWKDEAFWLVTRLSRDEILAFLLEDYAPTPVLNPWNGGSGFYFREEKTKEKDQSTGKLKKTGVRNAPTAATRAIEALLGSTSPRLANYRECARIAMSLVSDLGLEAAPADADKAGLIAGFRSRLHATGLAWVDASVMSLGEDFDCAPMVGSGGNDGNEDFSKNFLERVLLLLEQGTPDRRLFLAQCLFGGAVPGAHDSAAGQFSPGGNAGVNAGPGFDGSPVGNPWEYVLAIEGSLLFGGAASRRLEASTAGASFPFTVRVDPVGYGSAADADRDGSRAEIWLPLWDRPASLAEVSSLFGEGRARLRRADAQRTTDFAHAVAALGTSRGVSAFERTAFFTRNGNMHYSVPIGRWAVSAQPHVELLEDIETWVGRLRRVSRDDLAPQALRSATRVVDESILAVCRAGHDPARWQALLVALGRAETALCTMTRTAGDPARGLAPLPPLRPAWLQAIDDGSVELRLAVALANQDAVFRTKGGEVYGNVRGHWMPIDHSKAGHRPHHEQWGARFATDSDGLANDPDVVCAGEDLERDAIALLARRVQLASSLKNRGMGLVGRRGCEAPIADVMAFLARDIDDAHLLALARPLMALKWWEVTEAGLGRPARTPPDAAYALLRIAHLDQSVSRHGEPIQVRLDAEPMARLASGDLATAAAVCLRRLRASGLRPTLRHLVGDARHARRLAASLAFPLSPGDVRACADLVTKPDLTTVA